MAGYVNQPSTSNACTRNRKTMLFVLANGRTQEMPCKVVLTEPDIESWDLILDLIARNLDFPMGVQYLYTVAGEAIRNPRSLQNANIYVAVPRNEAFSHLDYVRVFRSLLPMREVDLKRIDMSAELPRQVNDPVVVNVAQTGGYNIVGKSKSDGLATINNTCNYTHNFFCHQNKKRPMEVSQAHVAPAPASSKQIQATIKPFGDVKGSIPPATKSKKSSAQIPGNDPIKEEIENFTHFNTQPDEYLEFIQAWLLGVMFDALDKLDDENADEAITEDELAPNSDTRSDDGYLTSDEKDEIEDQYKTEQETCKDFDDCRNICMFTLYEESIMMPETISPERRPDSKDTDSDISNPTDKADDIPSIDLEFDENMSVRIGSKNVVIAVTLEELKTFDEEKMTEMSAAPVFAGGSSEKLDSNETPDHEVNNSIKDPKMYKNDQHLFGETLIGPCKIPNCPSNRVPQHLTVYQSSCSRGRANSITNKGQAPRTSYGTNAASNSQQMKNNNDSPNSRNMIVADKRNVVSSMENPKNVSRNSKIAPKYNYSINNGAKFVNNNKKLPIPSSFQEDNRKGTIEISQKQCYSEDSPFSVEKPVAQMQKNRRPTKDTGKTVVIRQNDAAYNSYVSNRYESNTVQNQSTSCSPDDCPLKINGHERSNDIERTDGTNQTLPAVSVVETSQRQYFETTANTLAPISHDSSIDQYNATLTPPNSLATTSSDAKKSLVPVATKINEKHENGKCEEFCQPCPFKDGKDKGTKRSKPQNSFVPPKNDVIKSKTVRDSSPSVRDSKLASTSVKKPCPNNKISAPSSSLPKNIPVKRGSSNDYKIPAPPPNISSSKTLKPQNQITTSKIRSDQAKGKLGPCKTCPIRAVADSKIKSLSLVRNSTLQSKRNSVTESPKPNVLKTKQVKVEPRNSKPSPTKLCKSKTEGSIPEPEDHQDTKYCYPYNCKLKGKDGEKHCELISCQGECEPEKGDIIVTQEPELKIGEIDTTYEEKTIVPESPIITENEELNSDQVEDNKKYCYRDTCKLKDRKPEESCDLMSCPGVEVQTIPNQESDPKFDNSKLAASQYETTYQENISLSESSNIVEHESVNEEFSHEQVEDNKIYCYRDTCQLKNRKKEKYCEPVSCQVEYQTVEMQAISNQDSEIKSDSNEPRTSQYDTMKNNQSPTEISQPVITNTSEERKIQLPIQNIACMPITCNDKNLACLKEKEEIAQIKSEDKVLAPLLRNSGVEAKMLENVPTQLRRSIPENEPPKYGHCTSKIKPVKQRLNKMQSQGPPTFKIRQRQEPKLSIAKAEVKPLASRKPEEIAKSRKRSFPQDEPDKFIQCPFKNRQILGETPVQISCPFKNRQNQEIALEQELNVPTTETGTNPIEEVVPVVESAVVQTDINREISTQYEDKQETRENKATKYCYANTCQFKDRNKQSLEFQADSGNEITDGDIFTVIRKCNNCIPTEQSQDSKPLYPHTDEREESPKSYSNEPIFEEYCYLDTCQLKNRNADDENDLAISKTKCNFCGVVKIVETRGVLAKETENMLVQEDGGEKNEDMGPGNDSFVVKESVQFIQEGESPVTQVRDNEDQYESSEDKLQPDWHNFGEELEEYCYSDFPDWRKTCPANDCPIHLFKKSFTRTSMPPTIVEVDEEISLVEDLSASKSHISEAEESPESNSKPPESEQDNTNEHTSNEHGSFTNVVDNEEIPAIKGFHYPKCHVELLVMGDESENSNSENEAGPAYEIFLTTERVSTLSTTPVASLNRISEATTEDQVEEFPLALKASYQDDIQEEVPLVTETIPEEYLSKINENNRIIFAPEIMPCVSEAESKAAPSAEQSPVRSTTSIQKLYKAKPDERQELEQTPSQFINDIIRSSKVVIDKFKLKPKGLAVLDIKQPKCPDHMKQSGQREPCCGCPNNVTRTNGNQRYESLEYADEWDLFIFAASDEEISRQIPLVGTKESKETPQTQPCVTTIENLANHSKIYVPRFVTPVNFTQTYIATPLKEDMPGPQQKNDSKSSFSTSSPTNFSQAAKRRVSIKQDDMLEPIAIRYSIQEPPSPDLSGRNLTQDSETNSKDEKRPVDSSTGQSVSEPISLTTSTTTIHMVRGVFNRKTENCVPASLKEENQSKRMSGNTLESQTSRVAKCYCKQKTCMCKFKCLGRRLNSVHGDISAGGSLKDSIKPHPENGPSKSGLSTPSIMTPGSLSGLIVGENSSEYNGPAPIECKSATGSPTRLSSEQKESAHQISVEKQERSFENLGTTPAVTDDKNKKDN